MTDRLGVALGEDSMRLTLLTRLKICFEVLTMRSRYGYPAEEKRLDVFQRGYEAGLKDGKLMNSVAQKERRWSGGYPELRCD